jgi:hypothetical protein
MTRSARRFNQADGRKAALARRLNEIMREHGISVAEATRRIRSKLPEGSKFNAAHFSNYRNGRSFPRAPYLEAISLALGVPASALVAPEGSEDATATLPVVEAGATKPPPAHLPIPVSDEFLSIEDHGGDVRIRLDKRIGWTQALTILKVLKESDASQEQ